MLSIMTKVYYNYFIFRSKRSIVRELFGINENIIKKETLVYTSLNYSNNKIFFYSSIIYFVKKKMKFINQINFNLIPKNLFKIISKKILNKTATIILKHKNLNYYTIIFSNIFNINNIKNIQLCLESNIKLLFSSRNKVLSSIINSESSIRNNGLKDHYTEISGTLYNIDLLNTQESPVIRLVNFLINKSIRKRASDIHIEPSEKNLLIRVRIDGLLQPLMNISKTQHTLIISRLKIMSGLNIAENRLPQDGRTSIFINQERRDIRISTIPSMNGERMVLRLLKSSKNLKNINQLGFSSEHLNILIKTLNNNNGLLLVTGPTGSGKTTTLYACLSYINNSNINIMTIEDPIEYNLLGISQTQVNNKIQLNFISGLRSFLRQDPDIIMVGEVRDKETAQISINAALTGHLVLSTIHTTNSFGTILRLINMGIDPFLVINSILVIITQRLVRVICSNCKYIYKPSSNEIRWLSNKSSFDINKTFFWKGRGCYKCYNTGYYGRVGIFELAIINKSFVQDYSKNINKNNIKKYVSVANNDTLLNDGIKKIFSGITTIHEISRISKIE